MTLQKIPIWLDCDPGNDDAFAILLAVFDPRFQLLGISTVHGNAPLKCTTHNTVALLDILNTFHVKVYAGEELPLLNEPRFALDIHGKTGIGGAKLPLHTKNKPVNKQSLSYLEAMYNTIVSFQDQICIVCTGTLTNLAKLILKYPKVCNKIKYVSIMGGSFDMGNATPFAEFNFHTDPHAVQIVLDNLQDKIILTPLNLTHKVIANKQVRSQIYDELDEKKGSSVRKNFHDILMFFSKTYAANDDEMFEGPPLHDPIAVYSLLPLVHENPKEYGYVYIRRMLRIELEGEHLGETVVINKDVPHDIIEEEGNTGGVYIGMDLDKQKFWKSILDALRAADLNM
ncbi:URH1 [Candida oxycetoniae]|uniref:URH1 n=1 Tax=Candida oxycetoniae TaxID=497107 RepID=A0AAI9WZW9_9ASCO|nr:URH1 [Candida oxycetoniae]KAI3406325.1 URH1 [Candida oxycetoniae]